MTPLRATRSAAGRLSRLAPAALAALVLALAPPPPPVRAQQFPDTTFDVSVARPVFTAEPRPRLAIAEGHHEFHTASGRYRPFADLARADGFEVVPLPGALTDSSLAPLRVLVTANAMGDADMGSARAEKPAFTPEEVEAVEAWVRAGGSLLLIADHAPFGAAMASLGQAFGVGMRNGYCLDPGPGNRSGNPGTIRFTAAYGLDTSHVIVRGRSASDRADTVATFTGQSLEGPSGSRALLTLAETAFDERITFAERQSGKRVAKDRRLAAGGRAQALAFEHGRGRVVVLGEAAMATAQRAGPEGRFRMGMNAPGNHNKRFITNALRWLARAD